MINVYITDKLTGDSFKINGEKAIFNLIKGIYTDRFAMTFSGITLNIDNSNVNKMLVYVNNSTSEIIIKNSNNQLIKKVEIYNLLGQKVKEWKNLDSSIENRLPTNNLQNSIYIIKVISENGILSKKIIINE